MAPIFKVQSKPADEISFSRILDHFRKRWHLIVFAVAIAGMAGYLYLRYTRAVYSASASLKISDNSSPISKLGFLAEMDSYTDNIQSEIQLIQSRSLIEAALDRMDYDVQYFNVGNILTSEMYGNSPFEVKYDTAQKNRPNEVMFGVKPVDEKAFRLTHEEGGEEVVEQHYYGEPVNYKGFKFHLVPRPDRGHLDVEGEYKFQLVTPSMLYGRAKGGLHVQTLGYMVDLVGITSEDHVPEFAADFINSLSQVYVEENKNIQTVAADQALAFIQGQLDSIKNSVSQSEDSLELFKEREELVSVESKMTAQMIEMDRLSEERWQLQVLQIEIDSLSKSLGTNRENLTLPINLGTQADPNLMAMITAHNQIVQDRIVARANYTATHPKVLELDAKLAELRSSIGENVSQIRVVNRAKLNYVDGKIAASKAGIKSIPQTQRVFVGLMREYEVKERIFSTLLEKRAEASIARASIVSKVRIVDSAMVPSSPISPNKFKVYGFSLMLGFFLGVILVLVIGLVRNTIGHRDEVEKISNTPVIGVVRRSHVALQTQFPKLHILDNPKSSLSESFRAIRTNLQFLSADKKCKIISITSTVSGEGKSFVSVNLAGMISTLGKKVVVLDLDLRKPKLHHGFELNNSVGLSTFLVGSSKLEDILHHTEMDTLDVIPSGPIPPNPAELIQSVRMEELIQELKSRYDYIIIDTPPIGLVTDGTGLLKISDISLYVLRSDYSKMSYANIPDQLAEEQKIRNLYIILNSVPGGTSAYGKYGYQVYGSGYYSEEKAPKRWWEIWKWFSRR